MLLVIFLMVVVVAAFLWSRQKSGKDQIDLLGPDDDELAYDAQIVPPIVHQRVNSLPKEGVIAVAFVDTETTGLHKSDELITLGIVLAEVQLPKGRLLRQIDTFYGMREPSVPIHRAAAAVHGLSKDDLRDKQLDLARAQSLIGAADVLIAHNARFDRRMLAGVIPDVEAMVWRCSVKQVNWPQDLPNKKLDTICAHFKISRPLPHNALADAQAVADCLLMHIGKTNKSKTYLAGCLSKPDF